ncbi:helix-turn-helix transcriptional regulator [Actinoplanes sp. NPDC051861]|uniref:helix-turn-helix transcriptional regulator n=1 Tax=Actinoplanes sp. NPDC051861 TaxID=3155170 RepID=UPI00342D6C3B
MRDNLGEQLTVDDMARSAMFSKFHFTRVFQRATGVSPGRFLSALRLQRAKFLLVSTSLNVADISLSVGYNSVGTFSSRFTRSIGMSPTTYRRRAGYAPHIPIDNAATAAPSTARVSGHISERPHETVFIGLFPARIPEGKPVCCTVLPHGGDFTFESVPYGTWHLLAQAVGTQPTGAPEANRPLAVATHGPLEVRRDTHIRIDPDFQPISEIDPPVLLALMDSRKLALARVAAAGQRPAEPHAIRPMITPLCESGRTAA